MNGESPQPASQAESHDERLIIVSGPSGAGKSTVVRRLLELSPLPIELSVSATTRAPRDGEQDGIHYHFLSADEFQRRREANEFLECKEVFGRGDWYGTLRGEVAAGLRSGKWVLLEIDVEGALSVLPQMPRATTIFIHPGSEQELEQRLRGRRTDSDEAIARRLEVAQREMASRHHYKHEVVNRDVDEAVQEIIRLLSS